MSEIRCHSDVYGGGPVCPTTTSAGPTFPAECYSKYGGGRPLCDIPTPSVPVVTVKPNIGTSVSQQPLPFTGGDVIGLSIVGVLLVLAGAVTVFFRGRRNLEGRGIPTGPRPGPKPLGFGLVSDPYHDIGFEDDADDNDIGGVGTDGLPFP